jgi:hypothetical protein
MKSLEMLKKKFHHVMVGGDEWSLYHPDDALRFLEEGKTLELKLGIVDGFRITPEGAFEQDQSLSSSIFGDISDNEILFSKTKELITAHLHTPNVVFEIPMYE